MRLCQLVTRVNHCHSRCNAFAHADALSRFKTETGLFAPLDPDSRVVFENEDEDCQLDDMDEDGWLEVEDEDEDGWLDNEDEWLVGRR